jgi:phosphoribosyl 1,2-cyclic phosphodiesterase
LADAAGAKQLCLFHHDPSHDDDFVDFMSAEVSQARPGTIAEREGQIIDI